MTTPGSADQAVFDEVNGLDGNGNGLPYAEVAFLYVANLLGLSKDYAFPEGSNVSYSRLDQITTMAKILTRSHQHSDGNVYDIWDAVMTILKFVLKQDPTINNDEIDSVGYVKPKTGSSKGRLPRPHGAAPVSTFVDKEKLKELFANIPVGGPPPPVGPPAPPYGPYGPPQPWVPHPGWGPGPGWGWGPPPPWSPYWWTHPYGAVTPEPHPVPFIPPAPPYNPWP